MDWHTISAQQTVKKFGSDSEKGLSRAEVKKREIKYGKNVVSKEEKRSFLKKLSAQFSDFMVIILIIAACISFVTSFISHESDYIDTIIILGIVIINAIIGVMQESRAEKEIESLKKLATPLTKVLRDGKIIRIASQDVVPGDILILKTGDLVCADARIIESANLAAEESAMTGESFATEKNENEILNPDTPVADRKNMLFCGSIIDRGHAKAIVTEIGENTEVGKVSKLINTEKQVQTPLQQRLAVTGKTVAIGIMIVSIAVFILGILQHTDFFEMFMISISLAVAAIPEGLPAVVTIVLANGVRIMAKRNTIVRNLPAVETLGHASVICSDKTGTLTLNKMTVAEIRSAYGEENLKSDFAKELFTLGALCNNSVLSRNRSEPIAQGEPTENALLMASVNCGIKNKNLKKNYNRVFEIPFDSKRKLMTTVFSHKNIFKVITKGAPEILIKSCSKFRYGEKIIPITDEIIKKINKNNFEMASKALRVIAIAYKAENSTPEETNAENDLIFYGLVGIIDPPRPEAKSAVAECKNAGIKPVMITGDHVETAKAIAKELKISDEKSKAITGTELNCMTDEELASQVNLCSVFARVSPEHKVRIVKAFQKNGHIVAMTGDGVNDAPALKAADIGCAMGKSGTDAAKSASDMIITDDNFATIVEAVRQGRGMFENIKKTIHFLISTNIGEVMVVLLGFLMRIPPPLLAIHLLWINLVTDAFPALALGMDPVEKNIMKRPPISPKKNLFADGLGYNIIIEGCFIAALGLLSYSIGRVFFDIDPSHPVIGQTMAFITLGLSQLIHAFNVQSQKSLFITGFLSNPKLIFSVLLCIILEIITATVPCLTQFFKTQSLNLIQWVIVWALSLTPLLVSELEKYFNNKETILLKKYIKK